MNGFPRHVRVKVARLLALSTSAPEREQWRRKRFLAQASRYTPVIAVDDRRGSRYFVSTADRVVARDLFLDGEFETGNLDNVLELLDDRGLRPEQVVDVGANIGTATVDLLRRLPDASGVAFEPHTENFKLLTLNLAANGLHERVRTHRAAISDSDGSVTFEISPVNSGDNRVRVTDDSGRYDEADWATTEAPAWRLDTVVERGDIDPAKPTLLWIDAQGHESQILDGAARLRHVPTVVEFWPYGLERAGRLDAFIETAASYDTAIEISSHPRELDRAGLMALQEQLQRERSYSDLLLLPTKR